MKRWLNDFNLLAKDEQALLVFLEKFFQVCTDKELFLSVVQYRGKEKHPRQLEALPS